MVEAGGTRRRLAQLVTRPDVEGDHMRPAPGAAVEHAETSRLDVRAEAEHTDIEFHQFFRRAGAHMDVADEGVLRHPLLDMAGIAEVAQKAREMERLEPGMRAAVGADQRHAAIGRHLAAQTAFRRVEADLDAVAGRVGNVERFRNQVVLGAVAQAGSLKPGGGVGEVAAARHMDGDMEEIARFLRQGDLRSGVEHDKLPPAGAELRRGGILAEDRQSERVAPDDQGSRDVGHPEMDRPETGGLRQPFVHRRPSDCGRRTY